MSRVVPTVEDDDHALAARLAAGACRRLEALRAEGVNSGRSLGAAGDALSNEFLCRALAQVRPEDAILSEEAADDRARLDASRVWVVDPLDGTREYSEGRVDWAVHVALVERGSPTAAAVALPGAGVFSAVAPPARGASEERSPRIAVSRTRPPDEAEVAAAAVGGELVPMGSAGYKTLAVVRGDVDAYVHAGGQYEWDSAAPVGVALAAGLHCSRLDGSELQYNREDVSLPDLLVCRRELAEPLLTSLALTINHGRRNDGSS